MELQGQAVAFAFSPFDLVEIERESGCRLQKDYFTSCLRIRGEGVAKATELVEEKVSVHDAGQCTVNIRFAPRADSLQTLSQMKAWSKSHFAMDIPGWALSLILGRKGETVNAIRDESGVEIDVDSEANTVTLTGETENIAKAKAAIEKIIDENKVFMEEIELPEDSKGSFIGKGGVNIKVMQEGLEGVAFELDSSGSSVRVKGSEEGVKEGKERVEKWIEDYEETVRRGATSERGSAAASNAFALSAKILGRTSPHLLSAASSAPWSDPKARPSAASRRTTT